MHRNFALSQKRPRFGPARVNVGQVQGVSKLSVGRIARMRNQINLAESWRFYIPAIGLYRNVVLQQYSGFGAPINFPLLLPFAALQAPVHLPRAHGQQFLLQLPTQPVAFADPRHPTRQQRLQPHRPRIARRFPHRRQNRNHLLAVLWLAFSWSPHPLFLRTGPIQQSNRVLAVVTCGHAELVEQCRSRLPFRLMVSLVHHPEVLPLRIVSQNPTLPLKFLWLELGYILRVSTASPRVTF